MATASERIELDDPAAYRARLRGLRGDRHAVDVLSETPRRLQELVERYPPSLFRLRPFPGKWTPNEILGHLLDVEWVCGYRVRTVLCDEQPTLVGMDQEKWATKLNHNERDPRELVEQFSHLREINIALWKGLTPADLQRVGRHAERGEESLGTMLEMEAGHDLAHIDQLARYLEAARAPGSAPRAP